MPVKLPGVTRPVRQTWPNLLLVLVGLACPMSAGAHQVPAEGARLSADAARPASRAAVPASSGILPPVGDAARPSAAGAVLTDVVVISDGQHGDRPNRAWRPPSHERSGFRLDHRRGELLDAAWVRRQFELNGLGRNRLTVDRAIALMQLINAGFLDAGFINSGVVLPSEGAFVGGTLTVQLVLGRLKPPGADEPQIAVEFAQGRTGGLTGDYMRRRLPSAKAQPLDAGAIERDFRLLADDPAIRTVHADLRPGSRPGEATLRLLVTPRERFEAYVTAANNRSPSVGGERIASGGSLRNLLTGGDLVSFEAGKTSGLHDYAAAYAAPLLAPELSLSLRGSINNAAIVDSQLEDLDIRARDRFAQIGLTYGLVREPLTPRGNGAGWSSGRGLAVGVSLAHRRTRSFLFGEPFSFTPGSVNGRSRYTAIRLTSDYLMRGINQVLAASVVGTLGVEGTRAVQAGGFSPDENFKALLLQLNYARRLDSAGLEVRGRFTAQISDSLLYSGERLSSGGEATVRGYRENLLLTDRGVIGSLELSHPVNLSAARDGEFNWGSFGVAGFVDAAWAGNHRAPQPAIGELYGAGASLSWTPSPALFARLTYGKALKDVEIVGDDDLQDDGVYFRFTFYPLRLIR